MEQGRSDRKTGPTSMSPTKAGAILLGIYVAMHLAVGAVLHVIGETDAHARAPLGNRIDVAPDACTPAADSARAMMSQRRDEIRTD